MKAVWMRPTGASKYCRYSYDETRGRLWQGRKLFSDCGVWLTEHDKNYARLDEDPIIVKLKNEGECCSLCRHNMSVAKVDASFMDLKPAAKAALRRKRRGVQQPRQPW